MKNPRQLAFEALNKIEKNGAYSNIALDFLLSKTDCDTRDKAFVSNLFYGVIERKLTLDYQIELHTSKPLKKMKSDVLTVMRLGAYQILFMDKVPSSAAVNESVNLARKNGLSFACGLINAVLRKIDKNGLMLPSEENISEYLSVKFSCPQWLINKWIKEYGKDNTIGILEHSIGAPANNIRVNNMLTTDEELIMLLTDEGVSAVKTDVEGCLEITLKGKSVESLNSFRNGLNIFLAFDCSGNILVTAKDSGNIAGNGWLFCKYKRFHSLAPHISYTNNQHIEFERVCQRNPNKDIKNFLKN